jgi:hypothetical protein
MSKQVIWLCSQCFHEASFAQPSTRWGRFPPCSICNCRHWKPAKTLFDHLETDTPCDERKKDEPNETRCMA